MYTRNKSRRSHIASTRILVIHNESYARCVISGSLSLIYNKFNTVCFYFHLTRLSWRRALPGHTGRGRRVQAAHGLLCAHRRQQLRQELARACGQVCKGRAHQRGASLRRCVGAQPSSHPPRHLARLASSVARGVPDEPGFWFGLVWFACRTAQADSKAVWEDALDGGKVTAIEVATLHRIMKECVPGGVAVAVVVGVVVGMLWV